MNIYQLIGSVNISNNSNVYLQLRIQKDSMPCKDYIIKRLLVLISGYVLKTTFHMNADFYGLQLGIPS